MTNSRQDFEENSYLHVYNRGYNKERLFFQEQDYKRFLILLKKYQEKYKEFFTIEDWCFLPNHFHLLVHIHKTGLVFAKFMMCLQMAFSKYLKAKYEFSMHGSLYEGRYNAKLIKTDIQLKHCRLYIRNNPVKHEYVENTKDRIRGSFTMK